MHSLALGQSTFGLSVKSFQVTPSGMILLAWGGGWSKVCRKGGRVCGRGAEVGLRVSIIKGSVGCVFIKGLSVGAESVAMLLL